MFASTPQDLSALIQAMTTSVATDTAQNVLSAAQWELLAPYLQPINLAASEVLFAEIGRASCMERVYTSV
jgi:maleate cis-trans isomerase